jgi:hypothetical protein
MKFLYRILIISIATLSSCTYYGPEAEDGEAFLKLNWFDREPVYVDPAGAVPNHFRWDTYYKTYPGIYYVYFEYEYLSSRGTVVYPYEIEIEVWNYEAESRYDDGDDVFFELVLFPDGGFDYYYDVAHKNMQIEDSLLTEKIEVSKKRELKNGVGMEYTVYRLPTFIRE